MKFDASSYKHDTFKSLPALLDAKAALDRNHGLKALPTLGSIFRKYNQQHKFGLILLHRHFNQNENEVTVEILADAKTISMPWTFDEEGSEDALQPSPKELSCLEEAGVQDELSKTGKIVRPHSWKFDENGVLSPYEFFVTKQGDEEKLMPNGDFVAELYSELKSLGLHEILGLHLLHRGEIGFKMAVETSHPDRRVNIMDLKREEEAIDPSFVNVIWGFWKPKMAYVCRCFGVNTGHAHIGTQS